MKRYHDRIDDAGMEMARSADMLRTMYDRNFYDIHRLCEMKDDLLKTHIDLSNVMADLMNDGLYHDGAFIASNELRHFTVMQIDVVNTLMAYGARKIGRIHRGQDEDHDV